MSDTKPDLDAIESLIQRGQVYDPIQLARDVVAYARTLEAEREEHAVIRDRQRALWRLMEDRAEAAEAERDRLAQRLDQSRRRIDDALTMLGPLAEAVEAECQPYGEMCHGHDMHDDECALVHDLNHIRRVLDGDQRTERP